MQRGVETRSGTKRHREMAERTVTHSHVMDKSRQVTLETNDPSPTADHPAQGSRARKISPQNFWL